MNKYLTKIASTISNQVSTVDKKSLPYRNRVEILIMKDGELLVTKNKDKVTGKKWSGFPGGGVEKDTEINACKKECLEEVGIRIKNIKYLDVKHTQEGIGKKHDRHLKFRGSITKWYSADFDGFDKSKLGADGDAHAYTFQSPQEALRDVNEGKLMAVPRSSAIASLKPVK